MSPVRSRGAGGDIPIPYITPSLRDYPVATDDDIRIDNGQIAGSRRTGELTWTPKYPRNQSARHCEDLSKPDLDRDTRTLLRAYCGSKTTGIAFVPAPWRSLIYRNVDSPFAYFDDYVPFPHMPMNTFGFDCRAPRIMGDWMVGLPSVRKLVHLASLPRPSSRPLRRRASQAGGTPAGVGALRHRLRRQSSAVHGGSPRQRSLREGARRRARAARRIP